MIDDSRARKLSNDLKRSTYYETCSTYGLNVERVFQDGETELLLLVLISAETNTHTHQTWCCPESEDAPVRC